MAYQSAISPSIIDGQIALSDISNYDTNGVEGHDLVSFDKILIIDVVRPIDSSVFRFATESVTDKNQEIPSPAEELTTGLIVPSSFATMNGVYTVRLISIPTWSNSFNYAGSRIVYYEPTGLLYISLSDVSSGNDPETSGDWETITVSNIITNPTYSAYIAIEEVTYSELTQNTNTFETSLFVNSKADISINSDASALTIVAHNNNSTCDEPGHATEDFQDYIKLSVTGPAGGQTVYDGDDIPTIDSGISEYTHMFPEETPDDGIYTVELWNYPTYNENAYYNSASIGFPVIVYYNGKLYQTTTPTMLAPDETGNPWTEYTGDGKETRYYDMGRFVTLSFKIRPFYEDLAYKQSSKIHQNPCGVDLCSDKCLSKLIKMRILMDMVDVNTCKGRYSAVKENITAINTLKCDGCC